MTRITIGELTALMYDGTDVQISGVGEDAPVAWIGPCDDVPEEYASMEVSYIWSSTDSSILNIETEELPSTK